MKADPRACKIPMTEFDHLTIGEADEWERLYRERRYFSNRFQWLHNRRVFPDRGYNRAMRHELGRLI